MKEQFTKKVALDPADFFGRKIRQVVRTDGLKLVLDDGSWVCYRCLERNRLSVSYRGPIAERFWQTDQRRQTNG